MATRNLKHLRYQIDRSEVGQCWVDASANDIGPDDLEQIRAKWLDGDIQSGGKIRICDRHYRVFAESRHVYRTVDNEYVTDLDPWGSALWAVIGPAPYTGDRDDELPAKYRWLTDEDWGHLETQMVMEYEE